MKQTTYIQTPLLHSERLSIQTQKNIYLKMDALQPSGSFKDRGISNLCQHLAAQKVKGFVSSSGGNAGIAVAHAGRALGLDVKIIVPSNAILLTVSKMLELDGDVITKGDTWNDANEYAKALAEKLDYAYIPPFDHPLIWQGYATIIDELDQADCKPDAIITSVGGGGLYSGLITGLQQKKWQDVPIITAETEGAATLANSMQQNDRIMLDKIDTIAVTLGAKQICQQAFEFTQVHPTFPQTVTDKQAVKACLQFADDHRLIVEPACGAALAIAYENFPILNDFKNIVIIVCGGNGVSLDLLSEWRQTFAL